jgi:GDP-L-fucose synthase
VHTSAKIYVAGHRGLVGSALVRRLNTAGYTNLVLRTHEELDLTNQAAVRKFFSEECPEYVFFAAAKVGGILANATFPAHFIYQNIVIQTNVIHEAYRANVNRLLFLGSSCIYPKHAPQPIREEYLLTGPLEPTNRPYAVAKISGVEMCWSYNRQYGTKFLAAMPTNLYGPGDHYDPNESHVIPGLIRKMHDAKVEAKTEATIWGSGKPRREFLYSDDAADACVFLMNLPDEKLNPIIRDEESPPLTNIGCGEDLTIGELAQMTAEVIGFTGKLAFDRSKPDGTPRKLLDISRLNSLGWKRSTDLRTGLVNTYRDFLDRNARWSGSQRVSTGVV